MVLGITRVQLASLPIGHIIYMRIMCFLFEDVTKFAFDNMQTSNVFSTFDIQQKFQIGSTANPWQNPCSKTDFICHEANTFSNNNKQVIYSSNITGPQLTINVGVMQCVFSLLGAMELDLTVLALGYQSSICI